ncbi:hypothetical protein EB008_05070 [bacterium]|nr:hypothetical protein [bacterium]
MNFGRDNHKPVMATAIPPWSSCFSIFYWTIVFLIFLGSFFLFSFFSSFFLFRVSLQKQKL